MQSPVRSLGSTGAKSRSRGSIAKSWPANVRATLAVVVHAAEGGDPQVTLALLDAVQQARTRIAGNVPPLLAIEALLARIAVSHR